MQEFRALVRTYFTESNFLSPLRGRMESEKSQKARLEINKKMAFAESSCRLSGFYPVVSYGAPLEPNAPRQINLLASIFALDRFRIAPSVLIDHLDRTIGYYEDNKPRLFRQLFNPFFWIKWLVVKLLRIPFDILGAAGFDASAIEHSTAGKIVKATWGFGTTLLLVLVALQSVGWLSPIKQFFDKIVH
jgi:hypothetical protein